MKFIFTRDIQNDLQEVDHIFKRSLLPWWDEISAYMPEVDQDPGFRLLPVMVLNAYKYLGMDRGKSVPMANLFKTIDFASRIHVMVKDDEEGQTHNQAMQFTILIGDYIFGRVLKLLLENRADQFLGLFAAMICTINEGLIIEYKLNGDLEQVLAKTRASMYKNAFLIAGQTAQITPEATETYGEIGFNLGTALELIFVHGQMKRARVYVDKAEKLLRKMDLTGDHNLQVLENLINDIGHNCEVA